MIKQKAEEKRMAAKEQATALLSDFKAEFGSECNLTPRQERIMKWLKAQFKYEEPVTSLARDANGRYDPYAVFAIEGERNVIRTIEAIIKTPLS